jgi:hypothetical protein
MASQYPEGARRASGFPGTTNTPVAACTDPELGIARARAEVALRQARDEFARRHPERAIVALHHAWDALAHVPGGEAFEDLVALDRAIEAACQHLDHAHVDLAVLTMDKVIARIHP